MALRQDFTIDAGRDYALAVTIAEEDGTTALDLTGSTLQWAVSRGPGQAALVSKSSDNIAEIEVTSAPEGEARITLAPSDTENLGGATYSHEMVVTGADGTESTVFRGLLSITQSLIAAP